MHTLQERRIVTCFLECEDQILLLRRSEQVGSYQGRWAGVSGYVEAPPDEQAVTEIIEETGLGQRDIILLKKGEPLLIDDERIGVEWIVYPYLFHIKDRNKVHLDWEHEEYKWIDPAELGQYLTVPKLKETFDRVYPPQFS